MMREITPIRDGSVQISDYRLDNYYLVIGEERAALIDCGCGLGDPLAEVRTLTDLPVFVILTHGHADHCGTAHLFDEVHMHPADHEVAMSMWGVDFIRFYVETRAPLRNPREGIVEELLRLVPDTVPADGFAFQPLADGQVFDLGGRELEILATPGHTPGSVSVLDRRSRLLYTGDAANLSSIIPSKEGGTRAEIEEFRASMAAMLARGDEFDLTCPGHDGLTYEKDVLRDYLTLCEGILDGSVTGAYEEAGIRKGRVARRGRVELWYEADA